MKTHRTLTLLLGLLLAGSLSSCSSGSGENGGGEPTATNRLVVTFVETPGRHGQAIVIRTPGGKTYLVDSGWKSAEYDAGRDTIVPLLREWGVSEIDGLLLTHAHRDHYGGAQSVIEALPVRQLIDSGLDIGGPAMEEYRNLRVYAGTRSMAYRAVTAGDRLEWDDELEVEVLSPPAEYLQLDQLPAGEHAVLNNNSVILRIRHGDIVFLLPGDAYGQESMYLLRAWGADKYKATILGAPHHGFNATPGFAEAVSPEVVVASCLLYYGNSPDVPSPADHTRTTFEPVGATVYATPWHGHVSIESDGRTYQVTTARERSDVTPPAVSTTGAVTDVLPDGSITVTFNEPVICHTLNTSTFQIAGVSGTVSCNGATASFQPAESLLSSMTYQATLIGGTKGVRDSAGNPMAADYRWSFTTLDDMEVPTAEGATELFRYPYLHAESATRMRLLWATTASGNCTVRYRSVKDSGWLTQDTCSEERFTSAATGLPGDFYQHETVLDGLRPGTRYVYDILHAGQTLARNVPLKTLDDSRNSAVQFVAFADSGVGNTVPRRIRDAVVSRDGRGYPRYPHDFTVGLGDIAYNNGTFVEFDANFFNQLSGKIDRADGTNSMLVSRPVVPVLGNHEFANAATNTPIGFLSSFSLPVPPGIPAADTERYYSFDAGDAHFVVIDSMKFVGDILSNRLAAMLAWVDNDLTATARRWRIVFLHHAIFSYGIHGVQDGLNNELMRTLLVPILQKHGVQMVMFGHDHFYQRSKRMRLDQDGFIVRDANCNVVESGSGIVYVMVGIGGSGLYSRVTGPSPCGSSSHAIRFTGNAGVDYVALRNGKPALFDGSGLEPLTPAVRHGFAHVTVFGPILVTTVYNYNGEIIDQFSIDSP